MSVEPSESDVWTRWQGYVVNNAFPLGRCLGFSDHSGVFLTESAVLGPAQVAVKLIPADRALTESQLPRWKRAGGIGQPHLLKLLQWGGCQLDGLPYLYVVMEYADQTLAQVLQRRALTDDEALEMLAPTLDALGFLHARKLVQGRLKPENILAVGDELKLASDTIRRASDDTPSSIAPTVYDPPEARSGRTSTAGDVWALGVCLLESLTGRPASSWGAPGEAIALPTDFSPAFRDVVARCLDPSPQNRPSVPELVDWARPPAGGAESEVTAQPAAIAPAEPTASVPAEPAPIAPVEPTAAVPAEPAEPAEPAAILSAKPTAAEPAQPPMPPPPALPEAARRAPPTAKPREPQMSLTAALVAIVVVALGWTAVHIAGSHKTPASGHEASQSLPQDSTAPAAATVREPVIKKLPPKPSGSDAAAPSLALHEVIPEVPQSARRTITGHINVWVRVIVLPDGSVFAATADRTGPSMYFQRLAIDAARQWTFPRVDTQSKRLMEVRFDFSRDGTIGHAVALQ